MASSSLPAIQPICRPRWKNWRPTRNCAAEWATAAASEFRITLPKSGRRVSSTRSRPSSSESNRWRVDCSLTTQAGPVRPWREIPPTPPATRFSAKPFYLCWDVGIPTQPHEENFCLKMRVPLFWRSARKVEVSSDWVPHPTHLSAWVGILTFQPRPRRQAHHTPYLPPPDAPEPPYAPESDASAPYRSSHRAT